MHFAARGFFGKPPACGVRLPLNDGLSGVVNADNRFERTLGNFFNHGNPLITKILVQTIES